MIKYLITTVLLLWAIVPCRAQDRIIKKSGKTVKVKILGVSSTEVKYKKTNIPNSYFHTMPCSHIAYIQYENGSIDSISGKDSLIKRTGDPYKLGKADAREYYHRYTGAANGTLFTSLVSPLIGFMPAFVFSITEPKDKHLSYPEPELMKNEAYAKGYRTQAKRIKASKVWTNWAVALGLNVFLVSVISLTHR